MANAESEPQRSKLLAMRVPSDLYRVLKRDAAALGDSMGDVGRMRLKTRRLPNLDDAVLGCERAGTRIALHRGGTRLMNPLAFALMPVQPAPARPGQHVPVEHR